MKNSKKLHLGAMIGLVVVLCLLVPFRAVSADDEYYKVDGLWWGFEKATGTITWIPWDWQGGKIPSEIEGVKVTALGEWACTNNDEGKRDHLTEVILPEGLTRLDSGAFWKCRIKNISLPDSLQVIGDSSFSEMPELESLTVPGSVTEIGKYCFTNDPKLESLIFMDGKGSRTIGDWSIADVPSLKNISFGKGFTKIGSGVARYAEALETVSLPSGLKSIGDYAFRFDENLESVTVGGKEIDFRFQFADEGIKLGDYAFGDTYFLRKDFSPSYKNGKWYEALHKLELTAGETGDYVSDIFKIAYSQKGYHEGDSFDEQHGNNKKGDGDYAEYNYWWGEPGTKWCGEFAGWVIAMASVPQEIYSSKYDTPEEDTYVWEDTAYATMSHSQELAALGQKYEIKKGDVILFNYDGGNHVIIVESVSVSGNTVTIDSIDGNHSDSVENDVYKVNAKTGKTTNCWTDINGYVKEIYGPDWSKVKDVKYYTVKFDATGGKTSVKSKKLSNGAFYGVLPIPTYSGYAFDGWYTEKDGGKKITAYRMVNLTGNTTLYAHWSKDGNAASDGDGGKTGDGDNGGETGNSGDNEKSTVTISASKSKLSVSTLKKKTLTVTISVSGNAGSVKYKNVSASSIKKYITVSNDGKVTFEKGAKKGTYKIRVTAFSEDGKSKTVKTVKIKVK
ncbi:MAG: leucine-rich repeat protein [Lachnospiraceae bacterium]|nr:leucine-rich repeat protein [Lachnospiraceae bacterium]